MEKKVDLMRLVYGQQESLQGSSLQNPDSDSEDEDLFRLRKDDLKVGFNSCFCVLIKSLSIRSYYSTHLPAAARNWAPI